MKTLVRLLALVTFLPATALAQRVPEPKPPAPARDAKNAKDKAEGQAKRAKDKPTDEANKAKNKPSNEAKSAKDRAESKAKSKAKVPTPKLP